MNNKNFGREEIAKTAICSDCKVEFDITVGEVEWYKNKGYPEPKRCCNCRNVRKEKKMKAQEGEFGY